MTAIDTVPSRRAKGMGHLFPRGNMWYMRYRYNGKETTKTTNVLIDTTDDIAFGQSKDKANEVLMQETEVLRLKDRKSRLRVVKVMIESVNDRIKDMMAQVAKDAPLEKLASVFESSVRRIDCSKEQMEVYKRYIAELRKQLGAGYPVSSIDDMVAEQVAGEIAKRRSPNTYNKYLNGLSVIWDAVGTRFGCTGNPWRALPRKHLDTKVRRDIDDEEIDKVLESAEGELKKLIAIGLYTGMRMKDCSHLTWDKIQGDTIFVKTSKTGAEVAIPLHVKLKDALGERGKDGEFVAPEMAMAYDANKSTLSKRVIAVFKKCGIKTSDKRENERSRPLCGFHSLRHTFASKCIASGVAPHIVQALLGHASAKMTEHYTHLKDEQFLNAFKSMK